MRAIILRVTQAQVQIDGKLFSEIGNGLLVLLELNLVCIILLCLFYSN
jgi:D-Tyr-tRNAtyr deacylase